MDPLLFSSLGLLCIGIVTTALIFWFGAHRVAGTSAYADACRWTLAFAFFISSFLGPAPYLIEHATWLLSLPFCGLSLSLLSIQRIVYFSGKTINENHHSA